MSLEILPSFWARFDQDSLPLPASRMLTRQANDLAVKLLDEMSRLDFASKLVIEANTLLLLADVLRQPHTQERIPRWLRRAEEIFREELANPPGLADVALRVGVHPTHLARSFQRQFGRSVGEYVRSVRIEKARRLLGTTHRSVGEIGLDLGFCDQSHFNRSFKAHTGFTPLGYRRIQTGNIAPVQEC